MRPAAVVFDFDGVLVDTVALKSRAFVELFPDRSELHAAILDHHRRHLGLSRFEKLRWIHEELLGSSIEPADLDRLAARYSDLVVEGVLSAPPVAGAIETLELVGRLGTPAFIASGTPQPELRRIVAARDWPIRFRGVFGSPARKPDILRRIAEDNGWAPRELLFVGDGLSDWRAARATGVPFVLVETEDQRPLFEGTDVRRVGDLTGLASLLRPHKAGGVA